MLCMHYCERRVFGKMQPSPVYLCNAPLYRGHHRDPAGCPVYSGTSLQRPPSRPSWLSCIQWNLSIEATIETQLAVLYREVSLAQRQICTQLHVVWTADRVFIREVSFIHSVFHGEVPLCKHTHYVTTLCGRPQWSYGFSPPSLFQ